jgi:hypothetical protein
VLLDTVQASSLEWFEEAGHLEVVPVDEKAIPEDQRVPRVTSATWCVYNTSRQTSGFRLMSYNVLTGSTR